MRTCIMICALVYAAANWPDELHQKQQGVIRIALVFGYVWAMYLDNKDLKKIR